jgi:foldase protein PrsA
MDELAKKQKISLSEEETKKAAEAAKTYYDSLKDAEIRYMGISESGLKRMYENYALAQKLYTSLTQGVNAEVSDDEARIMEAMQIVVKDQATADKVQNDLNTGRDYTAVATDYNQGPSIAVTFGRGDMPKEVESAAFNLANNQVSPCIKTDKGFYFVKCVNKFNQVLTDEHKNTIVKQREKEAFEDVYESFVKKLSSTMNTDLWENVKVNPSDKITTNTFFQVYDQTFTK